MSTICIPQKLNLYGALKFGLSLKACPPDSKYIFDYSTLEHLEPLGMLLTAASIRQFMKAREDARFYERNYEHNTYAAHMGFFKSVNVDYGKKPGEAPGSPNYIPVTQLMLADLERESVLNFEEYVGETIERRARQLAQVLARNQHDDERIIDVLAYSFREIMRNVIEHSRAESIWISGQYWPSRSMTEIAILDEGIGIRETLSANPHLRINHNNEALDYAILPGISSKAFKGGVGNNRGVWTNSGYGLFMTSEICKLGGNFVICSGNSTLFLNSKQKAFFPSSLTGTAIRLRLNTQYLPEVDLSQIAAIGELRAGELPIPSIRTASKVSVVSKSKVFKPQ